MAEEKDNIKTTQTIGKELLQDEKFRNELLVKSLGTSNSLVDTLKEALGINIRRSTNDSNLLNINKRINKAIQSQVSDLSDVNGFQKQIIKNENLIEEGQRTVDNLSTGLVKKTQERADGVSNVFNKIQNVEESIKRESEILSINKDLTKDQVEDITSSIEANKALLGYLDSKAEREFGSLTTIQKQYVASKLNTEELKKQNDLLKESQSATKGASFLSNIFEKIPGLGDISKKALGDLNKEFVEINAKGGKLPSNLKSSGKFIGNLTKGIGQATKGMGSLALLAKELFEAVGRADAEVVELQKSFALNTTEAMALRTSIAGAAAESGNINITTTKLLANITELSKEFGFVAQFSNDTLVTMTKLTTQVGLTAKEAAQLAAAAEITDTSFEDIYQNVLGASYELQQQAGVQFDLREILKATNNVTGQVRANLAANPVAIAKAVTEAKLFGAELDEIVASSRALLDFQSSIESELEAELLLGRDINLERARSAALMGDQETVAKELAAQAQDFTNFTKLNVIQQDALAGALGMQANQLADILFKQEVQNKTARELRALGKEELANRLEQQTLADQFNATIEKLKGIFTDVATALVPLLRGLGAVLSLAGAIVGLVGDLFNMFRGDFDFSGLRGGLAGAVGALGFEGASSAISVDDGMIPPSGEGPILQRPEGSIQFNPDDTIIAGTDLFSGEVTPETPQVQQVTPQREITQTPKPELVSKGMFEEHALSELPDYKDIIKETRLGNVFNNNQIQQGNNVQTSESTSETRIEPIQSSIQTIKEMRQAPMVAPTSTAADTLISELIAEQKKTQEAIMAQTRVLSKGQDTIAKTKTKLQVGATDFGTELNVNSFRIQ